MALSYTGVASSGPRGAHRREETDGHVVSSRPDLAAPVTNFAPYSHDELAQMLSAADPASVRAAGEVWRAATRSLEERGNEVRMQLEKFAPHWQGLSAEQYKTMMAEFVEGVTHVAGLVASTRDLVDSTAEALQRAQTEMPAAIAVPALSSTAATLTTWPAPAAASTWDELSDNQRVQVADELRQHQDVTAQSDVARRDAVVIMTELAAHYRVVDGSIPELPVTGDPPPLPANAAAANMVATKITSEPVPDTGAAPAGPVFGDMYDAGRLAASAAVLGRFRLGSAWLAERRAAKEAAAAKQAASATGATAGSTPAVTAAGSSGGGGGGGGVSNPPRANAVLAGGGLLPGVANPALGATGMLTGTAGIGTSMSGAGAGMMPPPMMPPMAGGEGARSGRIPAWLVETEPGVFGDDSVPVTPAVIGELPEEAPGGRSWRPIG